MYLYNIKQTNNTVMTTTVNIYGPVFSAARLRNIMWSADIEKKNVPGKEVFYVATFPSRKAAYNALADVVRTLKAEDHWNGHDTAYRENGRVNYVTHDSATAEIVK